MFRTLSTPLRTSRFPVFLRAAGLAAVLSAWPFVGFSQPSPANDGEGASAALVPAADAARSGSAVGIDGTFDARQKALDARKAENDYAYGVAEHGCYEKFFVNFCRSRARKRMRAVRGEIHTEQLALDGERRAASAKQRDEREALRAAREADEAPQRAATEARNAETFEQKQREHALDEARREAQAPQRAENQAAYDRKQADFQRKLDDARRQAAQDANERAERAQRFTEKQKEAEQHRVDVEARQKQAAQRARDKEQQQLEQERQKRLRAEQQQSD